MKSGPERELLDRYVERTEKAGRQIGLQGINVLEWGESRSPRSEERKAEEASLMLAATKPGGFTIALDENGKDIDSAGFADLVRNAMDNGCPQFSIAIGGPDGHGEVMLDRADLVLRLGRLTWPHQLVRVLAAEQLYRAITILSGHPYHRT